MKPIAATCSLCLLLAVGPASGADCGNWNTHEFFQTATPKAVTDCLQAGADPNARDKHGNTPLYQAARFNQHPAVITLLLDAGADLKARDAFFDSTPLHEAAWSNKNPAVITALVQAGADPNARGTLGRTPLHWAASFNDNPAVITALLDAGSDAKAKDKSGKTPFDLAQENEDLKNTDIYWRLNDEQF